MPKFYVEATLELSKSVTRFVKTKQNKNITVVADKHQKSVVVNMSDNEDDTSVWSWQSTKPKPMRIKRPNQVSPILFKKKLALDTAPSTSYNQFTILAERSPIEKGNFADENEALDMITEDNIDEPAKPPPIFLSDVSDIHK